MIRSFWEKEFNTRLNGLVKKIDISPVLIGFNANIDAIKYVTPKFVQHLPKNKDEETHINDVGDLGRGLRQSIKTGKAEEWEVTEDEPYKKILSFPYDERRIGGQAGIVSRLFATLGIENVFLVQQLSKDLADRIKDKHTRSPIVKNNAFKLVSPHNAYQTDALTKTNCIFEFKKGMLGAPRANRFIVSYRPKELKPYLDEHVEAHIADIVKNSTRAFFSGYSWIKYESRKKDFTIARRQIRKMKRANKALKIHLEFTNIEEAWLRKMTLNYIAKSVHSLGMNEVESILILESLGKKKQARHVQDSLFSAQSLYDALLTIKKALNLERVHVHNSGYYLCVFDKTYNTPERVLLAHENASLITGAKAKLGVLKAKKDLLTIRDARIAQQGITALGEVDCNQGIREEKHHYLIGVPNKVPSKVASTVGLGDTVSSISFVTDQ
ncbi:hypothetical protein COT72_01675 [archaeon CG10_big_fil_rev_8_21_14_0_10_43_11]|nr:MAG: hypothetical protein COT72_01675 [archaeon CG10_big_fil_rev_8_21_14_0_10_43_11]